MERLLRSSRSALRRELEAFRQILKGSKIYSSKEPPKTIFLCGGNDDGDTSKPSLRRRNLKKFISEQVSNSEVFYAENVFNNLYDKKKNALEVEQHLFALSDYILIVLESMGSTCELGSFSHSKEHRKKLIIVNDKKYEDAESFINLGPLKLINDETEKAKRVLLYDMSHDGSEDSIGDIYHSVKNVLDQLNSKKRSRVKIDKEVVSKDNLLFVHDLIYFFGPLSFSELNLIIEILFDGGRIKNKDTMISLLISMGFIEKTRDKLLLSSKKELFYEYDSLNTHRVLSSFRKIALKRRVI